MQHCTIFCNENRAKGLEPTKIGWEPGIKVREVGSIPPPPNVCPRPKRLVSLFLTELHS